MARSPYIPGAIVERPLLASAATDASALDRPENFIGRIVMPDTRTDEFSFTAPKYGADELEAVDDDTIGRGSDFKEVMLSEGFYDVEIGQHGRKIVITQNDIAKAERAKVHSTGGRDPVFDLKLRGTNVMMKQNDRHNELLIALLMTSAANYDASHVFPTLNTLTATNIRETILSASNLIEDDTGAPANAVFFGVSARTRAEQNPAFLDLLPESSVKVLTQATLRTILTLPETGTVMFPTARVRSKKNGATFPIWDNFIWVGRVVPDLDGINATFGRNWWKPDHRNGQRVYVNEVMKGVQENVEIGLCNWYMPAITDADYGVLIPTTPNP